MIVSVPASWQLRGTDAVEVHDEAGYEGDPDHPRRILAGCRWIFLGDGRCLFVPGPAAAVRDDLYPVAGRWWVTGDAMSVRCGRSTTSGVVCRLEGIVAPSAGALWWDGVQTTTAGTRRRRVRSRQRLVTAGSRAAGPADEADRPADPIPGVPADPLAYGLTLSGHDGARAFHDLRCQMVFRPPPGTDRGPLRFTLGADVTDTSSALVWMSHLDGHASLREYDTRVEVAGDRITALYSHPDPYGIAVTWLVGPMPLLPPAPVTATRARLDMVVTASGTTGAIAADGTAAGRLLHYRADFSGRRIAYDGVPDPDEWPACEL